MVNTHRLLVTGHRVPYTKKEAKAMKKVAWWKAHKIFLWLAGAIAALALLGAWLWHRMLLASIAKKRLDVFFKVLDQDSQKPVKGATFAVMNKAGKKPIHRDGKPIVLTSDDEGNVKIEKLRGGVYQIVPQDLTRASRFTISLKHPKRGQFDFIFVKKFLGKHVLNEDKIEEISYQGLADLLKKKGAN
jgi:sortase A